MAADFNFKYSYLRGQTMNTQEKIHSHLTQLIRAVQEKSTQQVSKLSTIDQSIMVFLDNRHANVPFTNMLKAFQKNEFQKANNHAQKLQRMIHLHANDFPFDIGDKVSVIRTEHGWYDGSLDVIITSRNKNKNGIWSYTAKELDNDCTHEILHTRDALKF